MTSAGQFRESLRHAEDAPRTTYTLRIHRLRKGAISSRVRNLAGPFAAGLETWRAHMKAPANGPFVFKRSGARLLG